MNTYRSFAKTLQSLLGDDQAVKLTVEGYMPLSIERIGTSGEGHPLVAIAHTGLQNGDGLVCNAFVVSCHSSEQSIMGNSAHLYDFFNSIGEGDAMNLRNISYDLGKIFSAVGLQRLALNRYRATLGSDKA